jgi:hypothetical protein
MSQIITLQGRPLAPADIEFVRQLIGDHPAWSRRRLSIALCEAWNWRNAKGDLKDMASRSLLVKLHERAHIVLPPRRQTPTNRMAKCPVVDVAYDTVSIEGSLGALRPLRVIEVHHRKEYEPLYRCLLSQYHYLGYTSAVGENMKYLVVDAVGRPLACLLFGSSAWSCSSRDEHIGWDRDARRRNIQFTTNNTRFLILPWVSVAHLASHVLALICRRISHDWHRRYGHAVYVLETFVDQTRFSGTCYRAANWRLVGETRGRSRNDRYHQLKVVIKSVFVYPLACDFQSKLTA